MKTRRRSQARGAAMVEGIVVISTMLVFFGLILGVRNAYGAKLDIQQGTRSNVLYSASHACSGGGGTVPINLPKGATTGPSGGFGNVATSWNVASQSGSTNIAWTIVVDQNANGGGGPIAYQHKGISTSASASSTCVCNEPSYQSGLTDWFTFGIGLFKNGGGFAALGKLF